MADGIYCLCKVGAQGTSLFTSVFFALKRGMYAKCIIFFFRIPRFECSFYSLQVFFILCVESWAGFNFLFFAVNATRQNDPVKNVLVEVKHVLVEGKHVN